MAVTIASMQKGCHQLKYCLLIKFPSKMSKLVSVVVPVYKQFHKLTESERISWNQSTSVLSGYEFVLVCPYSLDVSGYSKSGHHFTVERFNDSFFTGTNSYNKLLLSLDFFSKFIEYKYILICQLDVFVFYDRLSEWCDCNYSYVGAPWFEGFIPVADIAQLWKVGNGGFSLRKVSDCIKVLNSFKLIFSPITIFREFIKNNSQWRLINYLTLVKRLFLGNNTYHLMNDFSYQEDVFWSIICQDRFDWYTTPPVAEALKFGFDYLPEVMLKTE